MVDQCKKGFKMKDGKCTRKRSKAVIFLSIGIVLALIIGIFVGNFIFQTDRRVQDTRLKDLATMFCIKEGLGTTNSGVGTFTSSDGDKGFTLSCGSGQRKIISELTSGTQLFKLCEG